jgi:hypothetical protein
MFYTIEIQEDPPLLRIALSGFWTLATFNAFLEESGQAVQSLMARHGRFDMLSDCRDFSVQGPEVSAAFLDLKQASTVASGNRIAVYTPSALGRIQAERLLGNPDCKIFASETAALEWLGL